MLSIDGEQFDSTTLFSYSPLQTILEKLCNANKLLQDRVDLLTKQIEAKDKRMNELENKVTASNNNTDKRLRGIEITISKLGRKKEKEGTGVKKEDDEISNIIIPSKKVSGKSIGLLSKEGSFREDEDKSVSVKAKESENKVIIEEKKEEEDKKDSARIMENIEAKKDAEVPIAPIETIDNKKVDFAKQETEEVKNDRKEEMTPKKEQNKEEIETHQEVKSPEVIAKEKQQKFLNLTKPQSNPIMTDDNGNVIEIPSNNPKESSELLAILFKKVVKSENKIQDLQNQIKSLSKLSDDISLNTDNIKKTDTSLGQLQNEFDKFKSGYEENAKLLEEMKVKMADFSIYDLFKDKGDGNLDASKALIMALENKIFKKFQLVDDKIKTNENDIMKSKNDLTNMVNQVDYATRSNQKNKELIDSLEEEFSSFKTNTNNTLGEIEMRLATMGEGKADQKVISDEIKRQIEASEIKLNENIKQIIDEAKLESLKSSNPEINADDMKLIHDFNKKVNELEKTVKLSINTLNIEPLREKVTKMEEELNSKLSRIDLNELYDKTGKLSTYTKDLAYKIDLLVDGEDKSKADIQSIIKRMESITGQYASMQSESSESKLVNKGPIFDVSKYIDINKFNENNKYMNKQIDHIRLEEEDLRRALEDVVARLNHAPSDEDFKNFQDSIKSQFDEQRVQYSKRFADKIDASKNFKYLDTQIKNLVDVYIKKEEGGDNWLLAKKPMSGYQCASCESNLKDLREKYDYLPWNKYPVREEKAYRMGHGFSRMLQMVNMDILKTAEANNSKDKKDYNSDEERRPLSGGEKKLPDITARRSGVARSINIDVEDPYANSAKNNPYQPKVVKIYKKNRNNSNGNYIANTVPDKDGIVITNDNEENKKD